MHGDTIDKLIGFSSAKYQTVLPVQTMDIWMAYQDEMECIILLDNYRFMRIKASK